MRSIAAFLVTSLLIGSGAAAAGTVTAVKASAASAPVGATVTVTASGTNPCGAAHIDYGDGTAITYAITGLPTAQTHAYQKPGVFAIVARGMGNCDGTATTRIEITGSCRRRRRSTSRTPSSASASRRRSGVVRQPVAINVNGRGACAFTIDFGDGNQQEFNGPLPQRVNHTYAVARTYTVIVAPAPPCSGKFTERLQVAARAGERITGLTIDPMSAGVGRTVTIVVDGVGTCGYRIEYGDGNQEDPSKPLPDRLTSCLQCGRRPT